jgi:hypothetical protein
MGLWWEISIGLLKLGFSLLADYTTKVIVIACYYCICLITTPAMFNITNVIAHIKYGYFGIFGIAASTLFGKWLTVKNVTPTWYRLSNITVYSFHALSPILFFYNSKILVKPFIHSPIPRFPFFLLTRNSGLSLHPRHWIREHLFHKYSIQVRSGIVKTTCVIRCNNKILSHYIN